MAFFKRKFFSPKKEIPNGLWVKCDKCQELIYKKKIEETARVCPKCNYHFTLSAAQRIDLLLDTNSFEEHDASLSSLDPLEFAGPKTYKQKLAEDKQKTGLKEAAVTGVGKLNGNKIAFGVTDSRFIMGSMGSVVGEKITRLIEYAIEYNLPVVIVSGSGGGARMYEGCISLMQMAKTSGALAKLSEKKLPFISVLTNPTMAGIMASFASLGDVIMAEPEALIGFTGPRVIQQTIRQKLPPDFQKSEFLLEHGLIDMIVERSDMKPTIANLLSYFQINNGKEKEGENKV